MTFDYCVAVMPRMGYIGDAIAHCLDMVQGEHAGRVVLIFNDTPVDVRPGDEANDVYERWRKKREP